MDKITESVYGISMDTPGLKSKSPEFRSPSFFSWSCCFLQNGNRHRTTAEETVREETKTKLKKKLNRSENILKVIFFQK